MNNGLPRIEHDHVLTGVKAKPFGWPAASPDPGSGRGPTAASGSPLSKHPQIQVSTVSGDCQDHGPRRRRHDDGGAETRTVPTRLRRSDP
jgi:hypothetical protein